MSVLGFDQAFSSGEPSRPSNAAKIKAKKANRRKHKTKMVFVEVQLRPVKIK